MRTILATVAGLLCCLALAGQVQADTPQPTPQSSTIVVSPGDRIKLKIDPAAAPVILSHDRIPASEAAPGAELNHTFEAVQSVHLSAPAPDRDTLSLSLWSDPTGRTTLQVGNGYVYPVIYSAWLVLERNGQRTYQPTSICPVKPGRYGVESWGAPVVGIAVARFTGVDPQNLACNAGSVLKLADPSAGPSDQFACVGGQTPGQLSPLTVALIVGGDGAVSMSSATWTPARSAGDHGPIVMFRYALLGHEVVGRPVAMQVLATASLTPPPSARAADIVLSLNGVEKVRRPWRMYAQSIASLKTSTNHPAAFVGIIPFSPSPGDSGLKALLAAVGAPGAVIDVRVVGDDGSILQSGSFRVDSPAVNSKERVDAALDEALAKAKTPTSCQKLSN